MLEHSQSHGAGAATHPLPQLIPVSKNGLSLIFTALSAEQSNETHIQGRTHRKLIELRTKSKLSHEDIFKVRNQGAY